MLARHPPVISGKSANTGHAGARGGIEEGTARAQWHGLLAVLGFFFYWKEWLEGEDDDECYFTFFSCCF